MVPVVQSLQTIVLGDNRQGKENLMELKWMSHNLVILSCIIFWMIAEKKIIFFFAERHAILIHINVKGAVTSFVEMRRQSLRP